MYLPSSQKAHSALPFVCALDDHTVCLSIRLLTYDIHIDTIFVGIPYEYSQSFPQIPSGHSQRDSRAIAASARRGAANLSDRQIHSHAATAFHQGAPWHCQRHEMERRLP